MGIDGSELKDIYRGALLHDIGKIGIPDAILLKPGQLTEEEFDVMKTHTDLARRFLASVHYLRRAAEIPYCHHEKWDGSGYPRGLAGTDIPLSARIFAVADVYDALRSERCYKPAFSHETSRDIIRADAGTHFDPDVAVVFLEQPQAVWDALDDASRDAGTSFESMLAVFESLPVETVP